MMNHILVICEVDILKLKSRNRRICRDFDIEVIPCMQTLGHMEQFYVGIIIIN